MIDFSQGIQNCGGEEIYQDIITVFCKDGHKRVQNLQNGLKEKDLKVLALETHSLKSVAATLGANDLADMAREINQECKTNNEKITESQWQNVIRMYQQVIEEFEKASGD